MTRLDLQERSSKISSQGLPLCRGCEFGKELRILEKLRLRTPTRAKRLRTFMKAEEKSFCTN